MRAPLRPSLAPLVAVGLYSARRRLWSAIGALAPSGIGGQPYRIRHALGALAITVGLVLPLPLVLNTIAVLLVSAPDAPIFSHALGDALQGHAFVDSFAERQRMQHEINVAVDDALRRNGIRIP